VPHLSKILSTNDNDHNNNSFAAEVAKSRHSGLVSAEVNCSRPLGGECYRLYSLLSEVA